MPHLDRKALTESHDGGPYSSRCRSVALVRLSRYYDISCMLIEGAGTGLEQACGSKPGQTLQA